MAHLVRNERLKLAANLLNTVAAASATIGVIAPFSRLLLEGNASLWTLRNGVYATIWLVIAALLHGAGQTVLREMKE